MKKSTILLTLIVIFSIVFLSNAQDSTSIKSATQIYLKDMPAPKIQRVGTPVTVNFPVNQAQGKGFFTSYDTDDGLALDLINYGFKSAMCDQNGNLWFGTQGSGVSKYDGKTFTNFNIDNGLSENFISSILEDSNGNIWFGTTENGVCKYDGKTFKTYSTKDGLADKSVYSILEDKNGNLWFGTMGGGVSKYDGKTFTTYNTENGLPNNRVYSIAEDENGMLWFGTRGGGICKFDGKNFTTYNTTNGLAFDEVFSLLFDKNQDLWIGTYGGGVSKFDGEFFTNYTVKDGLAHKKIFSVTEDKNGMLWFGTYGAGVSKFDGTKFTTYTTENGLANNYVFNITEDKSGNIWFGTYGGGVSKYQGNSFTTYLTEQGLPNNYIRNILEDKSGKLWFCTDNGFSIYDGKSFQNYGPEQGFVHHITTSIIEDKDGYFWIGTNEKGIVKFDGKSFIIYDKTQGLLSNNISSITEDADGNLWIGTNGGGITKFDGISFTNYTEEQGLASDNVASITKDVFGNLWIGTYGGGVSKFNGKIFTNYTTKEGLVNNMVLSVTNDSKGNLWFGTYGGGISLLLIEDQLKNEVKFITINKENGLPDNGVTGAVEDNEGNIIIGTNYGLGIIPKGDLTRKIEIYNQFTGYPIRDINGGTNNGALFCDSKGIVWAGTGSNKTALVRFDYSAINKNSTPPKTILTKVSIRGKNLSWYNLESSTDSVLINQQEVITYGNNLSQKKRDSLKLQYKGIQFDGISSFNSIPENLKLPFKHNALTFEFNAVETGRNFMINYQYKLQGMEDDWNPITKKNSATYNNLREGSYTFLIKAQDPLGKWGEPLEFQFKVLSPWYRMWWAYIIYAVLLINVIVFFVKINTRRLLLQKEVLEQTVKNRTLELQNANLKLVELNEFKDRFFAILSHDLKSPVGNIKVFLDLIVSKQLDADHEKLMDYLTLLGKQSTAAFNILENLLIWANTQRNEIDFLPKEQQINLAIKGNIDLLEGIASKKNIEMINNTDDQLNAYFDLPLISTVVRNLIANAIKFTPELGKITIDCKQELNQLLVSISDLGVGMDTHRLERIFDETHFETTYGTNKEKGSGLGLKLCKYFVEQHQGSIWVESEIGSGSTFIFSIPNKLQ